MMRVCLALVSGRNGCPRALSWRDSLTGLPDRRHLETVLEEALAGGNQPGDPCAVLVGDLDDCGQVDDLYGYTAAIPSRARWQKVPPARRGSATRSGVGGKEFVLVVAGTGLWEAGRLGAVAPPRLQCPLSGATASQSRSRSLLASRVAQRCRNTPYGTLGFRTRVLGCDDARGLLSRRVHHERTDFDRVSTTVADRPPALRKQSVCASRPTPRRTYACQAVLSFAVAPKVSSWSSATVLLKRRILYAYKFNFESW